MKMRRTKNCRFLLISMVSFYLLTGCMVAGKKSAIKLTMGEESTEQDFTPQVIQTSRALEGNLVGYCTATLLGPRHVITAAHCVTRSKTNTVIGSNGQPVQVISGILDRVTPISGAAIAVQIDANVSAIVRQNPNDRGRSIKASNVMIARGYYERYDAYGNLRPGKLSTDFDLAVVELSEDVSLPKFAKLPTNANVVTRGSPLTIFGFGCDDERGDAASKAKLGKQQFGQSQVVGVHDDQLAIGGHRAFSRQCEGDSGGHPLKTRFRIC